MNYLIIGTGGTGGFIGGYLAQAGKQVHFIARGAHLTAMQTHGLILHNTPTGDRIVQPIHASTSEDYQGKADVIFVCVKGYGVEGIEELILRAAHSDSLVIPVLNIVGTGGAIAARHPSLNVLDGCIYIGAFQNAPGELTMTGTAFKVVFGEREGNAHAARLAQIAEDLRAAGIEAVVSEDIRSAAFAKYSMVSPYAVAQAWFDVNNAPLQRPGKEREMYLTLTDEVIAVGRAMGRTLAADQRERNLALLDTFAPDGTTSLYLDLKRGGNSEIDGLLFELVRLGEKAGVPTPNYRMVAEKFGYPTTK